MKNAKKLYYNGTIFPYAFKVINGIQYIFTITPTFTDKRNYMFQCNENQAKLFYEAQYITIFECQNTTRTNKEKLGFHVNGNQNSLATNVSYSFNLNELINCWHFEKEYLDELKSRKNIKYAAIAVFKGRTKRALEWAVYHNMIGFDHIFLYVNQAWEENYLGENFITWIPFSTSLGKGGNLWEVFRMAGMTDIFWKAKYLQIDWLLNADTDEYLWLNSTMDIYEKPIESYLRQLDNNFTRQGIQLNSIPFGHNVSKHDKKNTFLHFHNKSLMNFIYREKGNVCSHAWKRVKMIAFIKSKELHGLSHHGCTRGPKPKHGCRPIKANANVARINHYKKPEHGVFDRKAGVRTQNEIMKDTDLRDRYAFRIEKVVF